MLYYDWEERGRCYEVQADADVEGKENPFDNPTVGTELSFFHGGHANSGLRRPGEQWALTAHASYHYRSRKGIRLKHHSFLICVPLG